MTKLIGTVLVKVSFVNPQTGDLVNENKPGLVQFDIVYGGSYNAKWSSSPYFINELEFGFGDTWEQNRTQNMFGGTVPISSGLSVATVPTDTIKAATPQGGPKGSINDLGDPSKIFWSIKEHKVEDVHGGKFEGENPYGVIPAVPFFNQDPGNRFFLPINEPLIYANHAINMRLTDLNHIAKYQSFGQAVVKGIERPINNRMGRPVDDYNTRSGTRTFGSGQGTDVGPTGLDRNFFSPFDYYNDGNADANRNGFSLGPDTMVSVGETGDFKFVSPNANISGLVETIYTMMDMVRMNYGLTAKHKVKVPASGAAIQFEKLGVVEQNRKRSMLFKEREQQLFHVVKQLWNVHHAESDEETFSEDCTVDIYYVEPDFAVDPMTKVTALKQEQEIIASGDVASIMKLKPHLDEDGVKELLQKNHENMMEQAKRDTEIENYKFDNSKAMQAETEAASLDAEAKQGQQQPEPKAKPGSARHSSQSSIQPGNGDPRKSDKQVRKEKQERVEQEAKDKKNK